MTLRRLFVPLVIMAVLVGIGIVGVGRTTFGQGGQGGQTAAATLKVDKIVVLKAARRMKLLYRGRVVRTYSIALGFAARGHKTTEGDGKTPEGLYRIDARNPNSSFHLSLRISYPNARDRAQARRRGVSPGGQIFIHGQPSRLSAAVGAAGNVIALPGDWTLGCIAVSNRQVREIWHAVRIGTPVELRA
ncbi:MAG TPA: L,D-transpeptidase family protein [Alphaproteobacteria bacterium]|nr:L,D-transpeptidase family protein [Alphaproteobacteria bacterium]